MVATAVYYGGQDIDFAGASSAYLGHYAETDPFVDEDGLVLLEADLHLLGLDTAFHRYPGTGHWFFEADRPEHDPAAAELAWERTIAFVYDNGEETAQIIAAACDVELQVVESLEKLWIMYQNLKKGINRCVKKKISKFSY